MHGMQYVMESFGVAGKMQWSKLRLSEHCNLIIPFSFSFRSQAYMQFTLSFHVMQSAEWFSLQENGNLSK